MIEVVRSRLDARERHRWERALAKRPILAARAPRARGPFVVSVASACLSIAMLVLIAVDGPRTHVALGALTAGGLALVAQVGAWMWREARASWPSGRFLYPWGYVEVEHDRLRYVDATAIETEITEDGVTLRAPGWSTTFAGGIDATMLAPLAAPRVAGDGYREGPWVVVGPEVRAPRFSRRARTIAFVVAVAAMGAVAGRAGRTIRLRDTAPRSDAPAGAMPTAHVPTRTHRF